MRSLIRIKPKSVPYRRAGLVFTSVADWLEVEAESLTPEQNARLAADDRLTIEYCSDGAVDPEQRVWEPIEPQIRLLAADQLALLTDEDWAELKGYRPEDPIVIGDGSGTALEPVDTLAIALAAHKSDIDRLFGSGGTITDPSEVLPWLIRRVDAECVLSAAQRQAIDDLKAEKTALAAELDLAIAARTEADRHAEAAGAETEALKAEVDALKAAAPPKSPRPPKPAKPD